MVLGWTLPTLAGIFLPLWSVYAVIYHLFFHPLAKYPGPLLAKLTGWYEFAYVVDGDHHIWLHELHLKYGPVVRVGPNRLSYNTTEALRTIYGDRKGQIRKAGFVEAIALLKGGDRNLQTIQDRTAYGARRRLIAHAFSEDALRSSEEYIIDIVRKWCRQIQSKAKDTTSWTSSLNMKMWTNALTEDILGELCFGESFGACENGNSGVGDFATEGAKQAHQLSWLPFGDNFYRLVKVVVDYGTKNRWAMMKPQIDYDDRINAMIDRRMTLKNASRKDFFHYIIQAKDPETGTMLKPGQLNVEAGVLFGAGADTSAANIAACLFYLTQYPEALARLTNEIRSRFNDVEEIRQGPELTSLTYLRACIDESLRFSPPVPGPLMREVAGEGITIDGHHLPVGTQVSVPIYAIHHNEEYFPDSWTWKPERWLEDSTTATRDAFCAFSLGPRVCIGRQLAYLDMTLALARLLFLFDVRPSPDGVVPKSQTALLVDNERRHPGKPEYPLKDWFITAREGPNVQFRARV